MVKSWSYGVLELYNISVSSERPETLFKHVKMDYWSSGVMDRTGKEHNILSMSSDSTISIFIIIHPQIVILMTNALA